MMWDPDDYPDDVPSPNDLCICGHHMSDHETRECKRCSCTYPRKVRRSE